MVSHDAESSNAIPNGMVENGVSSIPAKEESKIISLSSSVIVETYTHTWKIRGFNEIPFISKYPLSSPNFVLGKENETSYQVVMSKHFFRPDKDSEDSEDDSESDSDLDSGPDLQKDHTKADDKVESERIKRLGLRLVKIDDDSTCDVINYTFTLKTPDGYSFATQPREEAGDCEYETKPKYIFLTEKDFGDRNLFSEKDLDVVCDITYKYWKNHLVEAPKISEEIQFAEDFRLLHCNGKFSDVLLEIDGSKHAAHKSVLCARAPAFENLLEEEKFAKKQTFDLNMDAVVGKAFIHFLYCGEIPDGFPIGKILGLFKAADCYGVDTLKQRCSEYFKNHIQSDTCQMDFGLSPSELDLETLAKLDSDKIKLVFSKCKHNTEVKP